jgi:hypothetical protein
MGWLWALIGLLIIGILAWWLWPEDEMQFDEPTTIDRMDTTPGAAMPPMGQTQPGMTQPGMTQPGQRETGLGPILASPAAWTGMPFPGGEGEVRDPVTSRSFILADDGDQMLVVLVGQPAQNALQLRAGQRVVVTGGTLRGAEYVSQIEGPPLDPALQQRLGEEPIYLVVDEGNVSIVDRGIG